MLRLMLRYARRDLLDPTARRSTVVVFGTITLALAAVIGGFGFTFGADRVSRQRLDKDPFARTLWTGSRQYAQVITPAVLAELRERCPPGTQLFPIRNLSIVFTKKDGYTERAYGRTVSLKPGQADTIFSSRPVRPGGQAITATNDQGMVATPQLLRDLGYDPAAPPATLDGSYDNGPKQAIPLLGVTEESLPTAHQFLVSEDYVQVLGTTFGTKEGYTIVYSTPVPEVWLRYHQNPTTIPAAVAEAGQVRAALGSNKLKMQATEKKKYEVLMVQLPPGYVGKSIKEWEAIFEQMNAEFQHAVPAPQEAFRVDTSDYPKLVPEPRTDHDMVAVVATDLDALIPASIGVAQVETTIGKLPVNRDAVEKIERLNEQTRLMVETLSVVEFFLILIAVSNLYVIQTMRADRQIAEVGMLKAMGMSRGLVLATYLLEAFLLWLPAALTGVLAGIAATFCLAYRKYHHNPEELAHGFYCEWSLLWLVFAASGGMALGSAFLAILRSVFTSPSESLRDGR